MAIGDVLSTQFFGTGGTALTLAAPVPVGHTIIVAGNSGVAGYAASDNLNGAYTEVVTTKDAGLDLGSSIFFVVSTSAATAPIVTVANGRNRQLVVIVEGTLASTGPVGVLVPRTVAGTGSRPWTTTAATLPAGSISFGYYAASEAGTVSSLDSPWQRESSGTANFSVFASRQNTSGETDAFSGAHEGLSATGTLAASFATFAVASSGPDYTQRKGSTFDATHTLGTITTATLNGVNVFDHVASQAAGTINFTGALTDERTTSGVVDLVLGDGAATQTQTVQVNVFGVVPSNNPAQKDGSALASLTGIQIRITAGANLNGTEVYYSPTQTTDASGNFNTLDVSTSAAVAADPVRMQVLTAAGDSITSAETVELI
jgi:hypothetical protein